MKKLLLIGGGGHCRSVIDSVLGLGIYDEIGIVDRSGASVCGVSVVGSDDDIPELVKAGWTDAFITVGSVGNTAVRRRLYSAVKSYGLNVPSIIDVSAAIAKDARIGEGVFVGKNAVVNTNASVGCCAIINTGAVIEHDCVVGEFAHVSSGATACGGVTVGDDSHIGAGSVIIQQVSVGKNTLIGAGSVVVKDIPSEVKAFGNPCRVVE